MGRSSSLMSMPQGTKIRATVGFVKCDNYLLRSKSWGREIVASVWNMCVLGGKVLNRPPSNHRWRFSWFSCLLLLLFGGLTVGRKKIPFRCLLWELMCRQEKKLRDSITNVWNFWLFGNSFRHNSQTRDMINFKSANPALTSLNEEKSGVERKSLFSYPDSPFPPK